MKARQYLLAAIALVLVAIGARFTNIWIVGAGVVFAALSVYRNSDSGDDNDDVFHHPNRLQP